MKVEGDGDKTDQKSMNGDSEVSPTDYGSSGGGATAALDFRRNRYPFCIVWTPIPLLTLVIFTV